jgi:hypothetical protein
MLRKNTTIPTGMPKVYCKSNPIPVTPPLKSFACERKTFTPNEAIMQPKKISTASVMLDLNL